MMTTIFHRVTCAAPAAAVLLRAPLPLLLLPLLLLNAALSYAGSRPKPRLPKRPPCPPQAGKKTLARQFAYQSKAETGKAMRRSNNVKHAAPARRAMASANRGARKGGF